MKITYRSIGIVHTPFREPKGMPIQPAGARGVQGYVEVLPELADGLSDLDGFSHVVLIYHFHAVTEYELRLTPFLDTQKRGVFATRAPRRPNAIGLSVVRLLSVVDNVLYVEDVDILDGTPLLDIKPYVPAFEPEAVERLGWLERAGDAVRNARADDRFS